jgi:hypothetical protein
MLKSLTNRRISMLLSAAFIALHTSDLFAQGCALCKEAAQAGGEKFTNGLNLSILSLFFLPFALTSVVTSMVFKSWWLKTHPESSLSLPKAFVAAIRERKAKR